MIHMSTVTTSQLNCCMSKNKLSMTRLAIKVVYGGGGRTVFPFNTTPKSEIIFMKSLDFLVLLRLCQMYYANEKFHHIRSFHL